MGPDPLAWARRSGGVAIRTTGEDALTYSSGPSGGVLLARDVRSGRTRRRRLSRATFRTDCTNEQVRGAIGMALHTTNRVFWVVPTRWEGTSLCGVTRVDVSARGCAGRTSAHGRRRIDRRG